MQFNVQVGLSATNPANYTIPGLTVVRAGLQAGRRGVILTTSPQKDLAYTVTIRPLRALNGAPLGRPAPARFQGSPVPELLRGTAWTSTAVMLEFNTRLAANSVSPASILVPGLTVEKVQMLGDEKSVLLTTSPQEARPYTVLLSGLRAANGTQVTSTPAAATVQGLAAPAPSQDTTPPRVVGAISTANTRLLVSYSEPMADSAAQPANYAVAQVVVNPEAGTLQVLSARFLNGDRSVVELTTSPQNELSYAVTAFNVRDLAGNPIGPPVLAGGQRIDPARATFAGTPPTGAAIVDSDGDGLPDHVELRGWVVDVTQLDGSVESRQVTSNPRSADTDGDGLTDAVELNLGADPRSADTDADQLGDFAEFTQVHSSPTKQDTDGDTLGDAREYTFLKTSPLLKDTDGDQIADNAELQGNRNPRVSDLPTPRIDVGDVSLKLNVKLKAVSTKTTRDLETKEVRTQLQNNSVRETSQISEATHTTSTKLGFSQSFGLDGGLGFTKNTQTGLTFNFGFNQEFGYTGAFRSQFTNTSKEETQRQLQNARVTTKEVTATETVERTVEAARIDTAIDLTNLSDLSYRVKNLQVTALMADPRDPTSLTPVATLAPEQEPADGFVLGPLSRSRGPILVTSITVFPSLVESLMENPQGLIFRISNFDIIDEAGRNFAFSSQEVVERTAKLTLDFGGALTQSDELQPNTLSVEVHRVATSAGRAVNGTRTAYGDDGKEVGITLREALAAAGLTGYEIRLTAQDKPRRDAAGNVLYFDAAGNQFTLTPEQVRNSYATVRATVEGFGQVDRFYRVRDRAVQDGQPEAWEVITDTGIDRTLGPDSVILKAGTTATLAFVRDEDGDFLPSGLEDFYGTSDKKKDTDGDGLDDRFETLIGWEVNIPGRGLVRVTTSGSRADTDLDGLSDRDEAPAAFFDRDGDGLIDKGELLSNFQIFMTDRGVATFAAVARVDFNGDGVFQADEVTPLDARVIDRDGSGSTTFTAKIGAAEIEFPGMYITDVDGNGFLDRVVEVMAPGQFTDYVTNPLDADTDRDQLPDKEEVTAVEIRPIDSPNTPVLVTTNPTRPDTDSDGVIDGLEKLFGLNPGDGLDRDSDGDGLPDRVEQFGWALSFENVTATPLEVRPGVMFNGTTRVKSDILKPDTDGDGLTDFEEFRLRTLAADLLDAGGAVFRRGIDSDGDGINDFDEVRGFKLPAGRDQALLKLNPLDADTDDDGLSDGEEAEIDLDASGQRVDRGFADRWIVNIIGSDPRRVYSNPLDPDADFDLLPDGAEKYRVTKDAAGVFSFATGAGGKRVAQFADPTKANTDGDATNDYVEVQGGTNPVLKGFKVTIGLGSLLFTAGQEDNDGDPGSGLNTNLNGSGDIGLATFIQRPNDAAADFLSPLEFFFSTGTTNYANSVPVTVGAANQFLGFPLNRSVTLEVGLTQSFSFGAGIVEWDNDPTLAGNLNDLNDYMAVSLGGTAGVQVSIDGAKKPAVLSGFDLDALFTNDAQRFVRKDLVFDFTKADNFSPKGALKGDADKMAGKFTMTMFVTR
ncbi:MAG: binary toxin-like calcium binding domain-containing protein [Gemmataceae bacterium]